MWELPLPVNNTSTVELCVLGEINNDDKKSLTLTYFTPTVNNYTGELNDILTEKLTLISLTPILVNN